VRLEVRLGDRNGAALRARWKALLLGSAVFGLLSILNIQMFREIYTLNEDDIAVLTTSLLLAPDAHWQNWFTQGYLHFFDLYPDWPAYGLDASRTAFTRPVFQFLIYLAHFVFVRDWASYQLINCIAVAGMGAIAFQIAETMLGLRVGSSLVAAMLVVLSPPVWGSWLSSLGFSNEPLATILVAGAFLAVLARRDFLCFALLFLAILTKETSLWAPFAAALTIMLRPKQHESLTRQAFSAAAVLSPVVMWLGLRFAFFGGIGGTYATDWLADFHFLKLIFYKLTHVHYVFINRQAGRPIDLLIYVLLLLWGLRLLPKAVNYFHCVTQEARWPTVDPVFLIDLWAVLALTFHFALPLAHERYATSVVVFLWPALVAEVDRRGNAIVWLSLAVICIAALTQDSYSVVEEKNRRNSFRSMVSPMFAALRQAPAEARKIYVLAGGSLPYANPEYVRLILGVPAEIIRIAEIDEWECHGENVLVGFNRRTTNGVVSMTLTLPSCANFYFGTDRFNNGITNGRLHRNDAMSYELPEADPSKRSWPNLYLGRSMVVHIRPNGPARFIIEHGGPNGIAWFDTH
jgi:hypothetical protein